MTEVPYRMVPACLPVSQQVVKRDDTPVRGRFLAFHVILLCLPAARRMADVLRLAPLVKFPGKGTRSLLELYICIFVVAQ